MKNIFYFFIFLFIALLTYSCNEEESGNDEPEETTNTVEVYYSYNDSNEVLLADQDTIIVNLTDTFYINVDISDISQVTEYYINTDFPIIEKGNYKYQIPADKSGVYAVLVLVCFESNEPLFCYKTFYYNVPTIDYSIYSAESPTYTIDVENDDLKNGISAELDEKYNLRWRPLILTCDTITGGTYELTTLTGATGTGTFTTTNIFDVKDITFSYNNLTFNYSLTLTEGSSVVYLFKQDLTEEFQTEYPDQTINEVSLSFRGVFVDYLLTL